MSHYAVAVFHEKDQDIEDLLAPYDENMKVAPYVDMVREEAIDYARNNYKDCANLSDDKCLDFLRKYGYNIDLKGNVISTYNPKSKWDWYMEGGRFSGLLRTKFGEVNEAFVRDIDFSRDEEIYKNALRFWEVVVEKQPPEEDEEYFSIYRDSYYLERYGTKEKYAESVSSFTTFAVVTPDGVWHEPGKMGWFGVSDTTIENAQNWDADYEENFIKTANPDWLLTIVDCHI